MSAGGCSAPLEAQTSVAPGAGATMPMSMPSHSGWVHQRSVLAVLGPRATFATCACCTLVRRILDYLACACLRAMHVFCFMAVHATHVRVGANIRNPPPRYTVTVCQCDPTHQCANVTRTWCWGVFCGSTAMDWIAITTGAAAAGRRGHAQT